MPKKVMTGAERFIAVQAAEEMIARLMREVSVLRAIEQKWGCSRSVASGIYDEALRAIEKEARKLDTPRRFARMQARFCALYQAAMADKQFAVCLGILRELKSMDGLAEVKPDNDPATDGLEHRTDSDLEFYQANGYWPEERPRKRKEDPVDPLDRLVH